MVEWHELKAAPSLAINQTNLDLGENMGIANRESAKFHARHKRKDAPGPRLVKTV